MKSIIITIALAVTFMACNEPIEAPKITTTNTTTNTETPTTEIKIPQGVLISNHTISIKGTNYTIRSNSVISYYTDGNIYEMASLSNVTVTIGGNNYTFISNNFISFHSNQNIWSGRLASNHTITIGGTNFTFRRYIYFHSNQNIKIGDLASNHTVTIGGTDYTFLSGYHIQFHKTTETVIQGKLEDDTEYIRFYTDGTTNAVKSTYFDDDWTGER